MYILCYNIADDLGDLSPMFPKCSAKRLQYYGDVFACVLYFLSSPVKTPYKIRQYKSDLFVYPSPRARGVLFVLKGPYDLRVPPIVKISQESESARLTKIILSKSTVKTL